jgi:serine/threonine-protein kinase ATR
MSDPRESHIVVPSLEGSLIADLDRLRLPRNLFLKKLHLGLWPQATFSLLRVLNSMMPKFMNNSQNFPACAIRQDLALILNLYERLWRIILRWILPCRAGFDQNVAEIVVQFLTSMQRCTESSSATRMMSLDAKASSIWFQGLADVFSVQSLCQDPTMQLTLTQCLEDVLESVRRSPGIRICAEDILLPALSDHRGDGALFQMNRGSLQAGHRTAKFCC